MTWSMGLGGERGGQNSHGHVRVWACVEASPVRSVLGWYRQTYVRTYSTVGRYGGYATVCTVKDVVYLAS